MKIWVDADACPVVIKEIIFRRPIGRKWHLHWWLINPYGFPFTPILQSLQVTQGFDTSPTKLSSAAEAGDLVITADILPASEVIDKGAQALNPRGELYTRENIRGDLICGIVMDYHALQWLSKLPAHRPDPVRSSTVCQPFGPNSLPTGAPHDGKCSKLITFCYLFDYFVITVREMLTRLSKSLSILETVL